MVLYGTYNEYYFDCGDMDVSEGKPAVFPVDDFGNQKVFTVDRVMIFDDYNCPDEYRNLKKIILA